MGRNSKFEFTMKTFIAFAVLAVVFVAVNAETYDWGVPCTTHNDCAFSKHNLYCRAVGGANVTASRCVQCMTARRASFARLPRELLWTGMRCLSGSVLPRSLLWASGMESSVMGVNQNFLSQA